MDDSKSKALAAALAQIEKQYGKGSIMKMDAEAVKDIEVVSTGSLGLDLALGVGGGLLLSRGTLRRLEAINRTSREIMAGDLSRRIPPRGTNDDFDQLAENLNAMLDRIEEIGRAHV